MNKARIDCDYWRCLDGDSSYLGHYLLSYDWAEPTRNWLRGQAER